MAFTVSFTGPVPRTRPGGRRPQGGDDRRAADARPALDHRGHHAGDHLPHLRGSLHLRRGLRADPDAGRVVHHDARRPAVHHRPAQGRPLPQRQGDDLGRRGGLAHPLGQGGDHRQGGVAGGGGGRGQGPLHGGDPPEGAVGLAALRAGEPQQRRLDPPEGSDRGRRRRADQGVHRHRALPLRGAPARPPHQGGALQGLRGPERGAQRLRGPAHRLRGRDPLHPGAGRGGAPRGGGDRRVPLRQQHQPGQVRGDQEPRRHRRRRR